MTWYISKSIHWYYISIHQISGCFFFHVGMSKLGGVPAFYDTLMFMWRLGLDLKRRGRWNTRNISLILILCISRPGKVNVGTCSKSTVTLLVAGGGEPDSYLCLAEFMSICFKWCIFILIPALFGHFGFMFSILISSPFSLGSLLPEHQVFMSSAVSKWGTPDIFNENYVLLME